MDNFLAFSRLKAVFSWFIVLLGISDFKSLWGLSLNFVWFHELDFVFEFFNVAKYLIDRLDNLDK